MRKENTYRMASAVQSMFNLAMISGQLDGLASVCSITASRSLRSSSGVHCIGMLAELIFEFRWV